MSKERLRVALVGAASRWASEIYLPALAKAANGWNAAALLDLDPVLTQALPRLGGTLAGAGPGQPYVLTGAWLADRPVLEAMDRDCQPDLLIVSTAPDSHAHYAQWSMGKGIDIILDKPPVAFAGQFERPGAADALDRAFASLLLALRNSRHRRFKRRCHVLSPLRRRAYWPYSVLLAHIGEVQTATKIGPTYLYIGYNDGSYRFPDEYDRPGAHGYRTGLGILTHTGYHFLDYAARCFSRQVDRIGIQSARITGLATTQDRQPALDQAFLELLTGSPAPAAPPPAALPPVAELNIDLHFGLAAGAGQGANLFLSLAHRGATRRATPAYPASQTHDEARVDDTVIVLHQGPFQSVQLTILDDAGGAKPQGYCRLARRLHPQLASRLGVPEITVEDRLLKPGAAAAWYRELAGTFLACCATGQEAADLREFSLEDQSLSMRLYSSAIRAAQRRPAPAGEHD